MISDAEIRTKGIKALIGALGPTETGRFLTLVERNPADYTEWRHLLFEGMSVEEIHEEASKNWRENHTEEVVS